MGTRFASEKRAYGFCDRCGFRYPLRRLKNLVEDGADTRLRVCPSCWEPDHPQYQVGKFPVLDPQALQNPRPDLSYSVAGSNSLGSRVTQWGWCPVGGPYDEGLTPNALVIVAEVGSVSVEVV